MPKVMGYHRPGSVAEALDLLGETDGLPRILLGGGTTINGDRSGDPVEVVDLQAAGLSGITSDGSRVTIGATTTLESMATDSNVPGLLADLARRELPSTLRTLGTIGGLVAVGDSDSELLAGLLAYKAEVVIETNAGTVDRPLEDVLREGTSGGVVTAIRFAAAGTAAAARTGRTPADDPIVAAVGRRDTDSALTIAMCGVAATPVVVDDVAALDPPGDFRGTPAYRRHLAAVLEARVRAELG